MTISMRVIGRSSSRIRKKRITNRKMKRKRWRARTTLKRDIMKAKKTIRATRTVIGKM